VIALDELFGPVPTVAPKRSARRRIPRRRLTIPERDVLIELINDKET